jgi:mannose-6-phosphate isomerase
VRTAGPAIPDPGEAVPRLGERAERARLLEGHIQPYAWGSRTALAALQGRPAPTPEPEAEWWIGAHPAGPARVRDGDDRVPLPEWIARAPERWLGADVVARFGAELPFLVKILAVERPLSIQVHPDAARAREGFERESRTGVPPDAPERRYRDARHKPELVCALAPFPLLAGFRPLPEIRERLETCGLGDALPALAAFHARPDPSRWRDAFRALIDLDVGSRPGLLARAADAAARIGDPDLVWVGRLAREHLGDPGALAPLFLNFIRLDPGEALFIPPGQVHCYLGGLALEVMASSDNVVRAGLTSKLVDVEEAVRIADFEPRPLRPELPTPVSPTEHDHSACASEFAVTRVRVRGSAIHRRAAVSSIEVLVCLEGEVRVQDAAGHEELALDRGTAALVPAASPGYSLAGEGVVYRIGVPRRP